MACCNRLAGCFSCILLHDRTDDPIVSHPWKPTLQCSTMARHIDYLGYFESVIDCQLDWRQTSPPHSGGRFGSSYPWFLRHHDYPRVHGRTKHRKRGVYDLSKWGRLFYPGIIMVCRHDRQCFWVCWWRWCCACRFAPFPLLVSLVLFTFHKNLSFNNPNQMAEEIAKPERVIPRVLMLSIAINSCLGLWYDSCHVVLR